MNLSNDEPRTSLAVCENYVVTITSDTVTEDGHAVRVYGLQFSDHTGIFEHYPDITCDPSEIRELFSYFLRYDVDRSQIFDIIEDFTDALHFFA